ncbi:hypothetical protein BH23PAT2_BH23PAT2_04250 [soil metagenome]
MNKLYKNAVLFGRIVRLESMRYLHYPLEFVAALVNRFAAIILLAMFWYIVGAHGDGNLDSRFLLSYYLVIGGLSQLSFAELGNASSVLKKIKYGQLTADLTRPIDTYFFQYARHIGWQVQFYLVSLALMIAGVLYGGGSISPFMATLAIANMFLINTAFNMLVASIGFYVVEASGIKNTLQHALRLLQGFLIPISLMPVFFQELLFSSPFASSLYIPAVVLLGQDIEFSKLLIGSLWGLILVWFARRVWLRSLRRYEAIGL